MPRPFDQREQAEIRGSLRDAGTRLFRSKGVVKTTVDELARAAGIAKGSFYKFYDSKEMLFFEILEQTHEALRAPLLSKGASKNKKTRAAFKKLLHKLFEQSYSEPLIQFMGSEEELRAVLRRVPKDRLRAHERSDQAFLDQLIEEWGDQAGAPDRDVVAARLTSTLLICLRRDFIGERLFPLAFDAVLESLVDCFYGSYGSSLAKPSGRKLSRL